MLILGLLGMYFDAVVVFFTISSLLFRMAMAVLCSAVRLKPKPDFGHVAQAKIRFCA